MSEKNDFYEIWRAVTNSLTAPFILLIKLGFYILIYIYKWLYLLIDFIVSICFAKDNQKLQKIKPEYFGHSAEQLPYSSFRRITTLHKGDKSLALHKAKTTTLAKVCKKGESK